MATRYYENKGVIDGQAWDTVRVVSASGFRYSKTGVSLHRATWSSTATSNVAQVSGAKIPLSGYNCDTQDLWIRMDLYLNTTYGIYPFEVHLSSTQHSQLLQVAQITHSTKNNVHREYGAKILTEDVTYPKNQVFTLAANYSHTNNNINLYVNGSLVSTGTSSSKKQWDGVRLEVGYSAYLSNIIIADYNVSNATLANFPGTLLGDTHRFVALGSALTGDTQRALVVDSGELAGDTARKLASDGTLRADTERRFANSGTLAGDALRDVIINASLSGDTARVITNAGTLAGDTLRELNARGALVSDTKRELNAAGTLAGDTARQVQYERAIFYGDAARVIANGGTLAGDTARRVGGAAVLFADTLREVTGPPTPRIRLYNGTVTSGGRDGKELSYDGARTNPARFSFTATETGAVQPIAIRCDMGYRTAGDTMISFSGANAAKWSICATADGTFAHTLTIAREIDAANVIFYIKAAKGADETIQKDVSVVLSVAATLEYASM